MLLTALTTGLFLLPRSSEFVVELEDVMEKHVGRYNRYQKQRGVEEWGERLQEGGESASEAVGLRLAELASTGKGGPCACSSVVQCLSAPFIHL